MQEMVADRYQIVRSIGKGSFGRTLLARDRVGNRDVALKVLDRNGDVDLKALELFEREATVLRSLRHQGVPEVLDWMRADWEGAPATFLVMEFVDGKTLATMIDEKSALDPETVMHLFIELLGVLDYLHTRVPPVVHRDIKPANIVVRADGQPVIVDFGAVRRAYHAPDESGSTIVGTYGYMPYEQYMGQATASSDLYSLAATFVHLLTGRPPRDFMNTDGRIEVPIDLPGDARLRSVIARLLSPSPAERFATAREVRTAMFATTAVTRNPVPSQLVARNTIDMSPLGAVPRAMDAQLVSAINRVAPSALEYMDSGAKPGDKLGISDWVSLAFFSTVTLGILPLIFVAVARARRKRLRRFFREGIATTAKVLSIGADKIAFDVAVAKVTYEFTVDGEVFRDADQVLPVIANRCQPGDVVQILYLPDVEYDSVIVATINRG